MKPTTLKSWVVLVMLAATIVGVLAWALWPRALEVDLGEVDEGVFERSFTRDGKTRLRERHAVTAPVAGRLERIALREGDAVRRGEVIARIVPLATALLDARALEEQRERVAALSAQWQRARLLLAQSGVALVQAQADLARAEALAAQGFVSPLQAEAQRLLMRQREAERDAAAHDEVAARHQLALGQVALQPATAGSMAAPSLVRAPLDARVIRLTRDSEGEVTQGATLLELGDLDQLEVVVDLLTEEAAQVRPGMLARLGVTRAGEAAGPAVMLSARVQRIDPGAFTKVSALGVEEQRVNVVLQLQPASDTASQDLRLRLGDAWRIESQIVVLRHERVRRVPVSALFPSGEGMAVFAVHNGRARQQAVTVLARGTTHAWVADTLALRQPLVLYPPPSLQSGQRVRARAGSAG